MTAVKKKAENAYDMLDRMITFQELLPGSMVSESTLMQITGLGRHPVRAALQRLSWERMVEIHPRKGIVVARISVEEQVKLLAVRRTVEELAVRWAAARATPAQQLMMSDLIRELLPTPSPANLVNFRLVLKRAHQLIVLATNNDYINVAMTPLQGLSRRFWFSNLTDIDGEVAKAAALHAAILESVAKGDEEAAAAASLRLNDYLTDFAYNIFRSH